ncbi:hypothetical protein LAP8965_00158 [Lactiplantibacillus plantarum]|uniref:hypothetical protein n=1 Tax=Lactiplantibacillus plantarum TaxID=1590 RepID=UPI000CFA60DC|nr:hypothetical protein [Lactiplantibacillus plantarum]SPE04693.1 hypothetical protein LAP8963_00158 [Lactiplantibacillus plantarum]SPE13073.1 hypothetical protein LAP8964_02448 [Lactiplantibacillus plantarum]SPH04083.1 hypothetical protein LAP8965_00158 [Lactiplantibacillus plantarum]SPH07746.1 hypothetical protein LAP8966_00158 [Lactiplantibacillus plantarum]
MKIMYPQLVEQAFDILSKSVPLNMAKANSIKADIYRELVAEGVLDENGQPTQLAFDKGLVDRAQTLAEFKQEFPQLKEYSDTHFKYTSDGWGIDNYVMRSMANKALKASSNEYERQRALDALRQVDEVEKEYFNNEN